MRLVPPNLIGSHAGLPENSDIALGVIPDDHVELLRCGGERHRALLLHARACVRDIHRLRDILRIRISRANAERGYRISKPAGSRLTGGCNSGSRRRYAPPAERVVRRLGGRGLLALCLGLAFGFLSWRHLQPP